jgi:signal peptidase II
MTPDPETIRSEAGESDAGADPVALASSKRVGLLSGAALVVLVLDQLTKVWAVAELGERDIDLFWTLRLHLIRNTGSAFGLGAQFGRWVALLVVGVLIGVIAYVRRVSDWRIVLLIGAIVGGAVGNLVDRVVRADAGFLSGGVVDFIDFQWWPVFNVADMAVVGGAIGLLLLSGREPR